MATSDKAAQSAVASNMPAYIVAEFRNDAGVAIRVQWKENGTDRYRDIGVGGSWVVSRVFKGVSSGQTLKFSCIALGGYVVYMHLNGGLDIKLWSRLDRRREYIEVSFPQYLVNVAVMNDAGGPISFNWSHNGLGNHMVLGALRSARIYLDSRVFDGSNVTFSAIRLDTFEDVLLNGRRSLSIKDVDIVSPFKVVVTDVPRYIIADIANNADSVITVKWLENDIAKRLDIDPEGYHQLKIIFPVANNSHSVMFTAMSKDSREPINLNGTSSVTLVPLINQLVYEIVATDVPKTIDLKIINEVMGPVVLLWILKESPMAVNLPVGHTIDHSFTLKGFDARNNVEFTARRTDYDLPVSVNRTDKLEVVPRIGNNQLTIVISDKWLIIPWTDEGWESNVPSNDRRYLLVELFTKVNGPFNLWISQKGRKKSVKVSPGSNNRIALIFRGPNSDTPVRFTGQRTDVDFPVQLNYKPEVTFVPNMNRAVDKIIVSEDRIVVPWIDTAIEQTPKIGEIRDIVKPMYIMLDFVNKAAGPVSITLYRYNTESKVELPFGETARVSIALKKNRSPTPISFVGKRQDTRKVVSFNYFLKGLYVPRKEKVVETVVVRDPHEYITLSFVNKAAGNIKVAWILKGIEYSLILRPGDIKRKEIVIDGKGSPEYVVFTAIRTSNAAPIQLNGLNSIIFRPKLERISQRVVATDAAKYVIVDLINEAKEPVMFQWLEMRSKKSKYVDIGRKERQVIQLIEPFLDEHFHFTAIGKDSGALISVNNAGFAEVLPTYEKIVTEITARDSKMRYLDVTIRNKAPGRIEISWLEESSKRLLQMGEGETLRRSFSFRTPGYKSLTFTSRFVNAPGVVYLNGAASISLEPLEILTKRHITATSPHIYLKLSNIAPGTAYTEWYNGGTLEKATVIGGGFANQLVLFKKPGDEIYLSGNISLETEQAIALYNGKRSLQIIEDAKILSKDVSISIGKFNS